MPPNDPATLEAVKSTRSQYQFSQLIDAYPSRLNVVAEGDSWFAYPPQGIVFGKPSNVIAHLRNKRRFNLLELSSNGDEAVAMLSGESKLRLMKIIHRYHVHFLLFSGGGNDVVGRYDFDFFLKKKINSNEPKAYLNHKRLNRRILQIRNAYEDLIDYCNEYSDNKDIKIVTHCYDYAVPDPKGAEFIGGLVKIDSGRSWMHPYFKDKGVPERHRRPIVKYLIDTIAEMLLALEKQHKGRLLVADTRKTLNPEKDWLNEIHPTSSGFRKIAKVIYEKMETAFD